MFEFTQEELNFMKASKEMIASDDNEEALDKILNLLKSKMPQAQKQLNRNLDELGLTHVDLNKTKLRDLPSWMLSVVEDEKKEEPAKEEESAKEEKPVKEEKKEETVPTKEEVKEASRIARIDVKEIQDDLKNLSRYKNSPKMNKPAKNVVKMTTLGNITVTELIDKLRDGIAKPDDDNDDISKEDVAAAQKIEEEVSK